MLSQSAQSLSHSESSESRLLHMLLCVLPHDLPAASLHMVMLLRTIDTTD